MFSEILSFVQRNRTVAIKASKHKRHQMLTLPGAYEIPDSSTSDKEIAKRV